VDINHSNGLVVILETIIQLEPRLVVVLETFECVLVVLVSVIYVCGSTHISACLVA